MHARRYIYIYTHVSIIDTELHVYMYMYTSIYMFMFLYLCVYICIEIHGCMCFSVYVELGCILGAKASDLGLSTKSTLPRKLHFLFSKEPEL